MQEGAALQRRSLLACACADSASVPPPRMYRYGEGKTYLARGGTPALCGSYAAPNRETERGLGVGLLKRRRKPGLDWRPSFLSPGEGLGRARLAYLLAKLELGRIGEVRARQEAHSRSDV